MSLALPAAAAFLIVVFGLIGLARDVQRGFLSLIGTLLGVALVQIWGPTWAAKVEEQFGWMPSTASWAVSSTAFLLVAILVGYGSSTFIPKKATNAKDKPKPKALARPASGLLGALNGAMIASILLLYARGWAANETLQAVILESVLLSLLIEWFSWFILGVAVLIGTLAFFKWTIFVVHRLTSPLPVPAKPASQPAEPKPSTTAQPAAQPSAQPAAQAGTQAGAAQAGSQQGAQANAQQGAQTAAKPAAPQAAPQPAAQNSSQAAASGEPKPAQAAAGAAAGAATAKAKDEKADSNKAKLTPEQQKKRNLEYLDRILLGKIEERLPPDQG